MAVEVARLVGVAVALVVAAAAAVAMAVAVARVRASAVAWWRLYQHQQCENAIAPPMHHH